MAAQPQQSIHLIEIPTDRLPLLVPSATIAEVVNVGELSPLPLAPPWVLGVIGWRTKAVVVVSFEALLAGAITMPGPRSKIIVFYPLPGADDGGFFGVLSTRDPQPRVIDSNSDLVPNAAGAVESDYVAATVKLREKTLLIPDMGALKTVFYP
ncbi:MAG: chemotaxis protein CheW [Acidiferrobacterales bacterium]